MSRTDLEDVVAATLRARASAEVDTARLLHGAGTRGRALARRRRRTIVAGAAAGAALVMASAVAAVSTVLPVPFDSPPANQPSTATPLPGSDHPVPSLPTATDHPGAVQRPDLVGRDPRVVHFTVDLPNNAAWVSWKVGHGMEVMQTLLQAVDGGQAVEVDVGVGPDIGRLDQADSMLGLPLDGPPVTSPTTIDGRPATLEQQRLGGRSGGSKWVLRWQPVDGLWARLGVMGDANVDAVMDLVEVLRLDRAQRCVVPIQVAEVPPGAVVSGCSVRLGQALGLGNSDPDVAVIHAWLEFTDQQGNQLAVDALQAGRKQVAANRTVAGRPAQWGDWGSFGPGGQLVFQDFDGLALSIEIRGQLGEQAAVAMAGSLRVAPDLNAPHSWPTLP